MPDLKMLNGRKGLNKNLKPLLVMSSPTKIKTMIGSRFNPTRKALSGKECVHILTI